MGLLVVSNALAGGLEFRHGFIDRDLPGSSWAQTALADIDKDGRLDYVTGQSRGPVFWYRQETTRRWSRHTLGEQSPSDVGGAALDVDGDGWMDFVAGGVWYRNTGQPLTAPFVRTVFDPELTGVHDLVVADVDGDKRPDVLTMSDKNNLRWYRIPDDPRRPWVRHDIGPSVHAGIGVGDLDGDGDTDVARSNLWFENAEGRGERWIVHENIPFGNPGKPYPLATHCAAIDLDRDGDHDLVMSENEIKGGRIGWLENLDGRGGGWTLHELPRGDEARRGAYHSLMVADFDNDGDADVFSCEMEGIPGDKPPRWFIWENADGRGRRFVEHVILDANLGGHLAVAADVDADGDLDIISKLWRPRKDNANEGRNHIDLMENLRVRGGNEGDRVGGRSTGGLRLTGRALVAVPQDAFSVFLTWRLLEQDGEEAAFDVLRSGPEGVDFRKIGTAQATTTFCDQPGPGTYTYRVVPLGGLLRGVRSNPFAVTTAPKGRDWVEIMPAARGRRLQFSERHFADTDGDGELEFVTYYPQVPSYRGGTSPESYKLQVYKLFDDRPPRWTFDTGMGTQTQPASGDHRADWDYEWTFKPVAHDIDGDAKAEIITLAKIALPGEAGPRYRYVVLKDMGDSCRIIGTLDSPVPVADGRNNSRHFPFFAGLGGTNDSFVLQGGTYGYWEMWAYDWNGRGFDLRWHVKSTEPGFKGNVSSSHTVLVMDLDGDGRDEINNGLTVLDDDGSVLWSGNAEFGATNHVDGQVIDDIHPGNFGLELMTHTEQGGKYALYDARSGRLLWQKDAPGRHLQLNIAARVTGGSGLDIVGVTGGHRATGAFACTHEGTDLAYPYPDRPVNGDRWWPMDWDGDRGHNVSMNFDTLYGQGTNVLFRVRSDDAPAGDVIPWSEHALHRLWFNVDLVGDYREDIPVQMKDGSVRVYLNTRTPPARRVCKWQNRTYQMLQAPGDYRYFIAAIEPPPAPRRGAGVAEAGP